MIEQATIVGMSTPEQLAADPSPGQQDELLEYRRYSCPDCATLHRWRSSAESCCPPDVDEVYLDPDTGMQYVSREEFVARKDQREDRCPVCLATYAGPYDAVNCCLWKYHAPAQRYAMAQAVRSGKTWTEAIQQSGGVH